jgi:hypothetical protein
MWLFTRTHQAVVVNDAIVHCPLSIDQVFQIPVIGCRTAQLSLGLVRLGASTATQRDKLELV